MDRALVHNNHLDDVFFVSNFLQGLNPEIRAAIMFHKPRTVDLALSLALMQSNILDSQNKSYNKRPHRDFNKYNNQAIQTQPWEIHQTMQPSPSGRTNGQHYELNAVHKVYA